MRTNTTNSAGEWPNSGQIRAKERYSIGLISWFRILLWWGTEVMRGILDVRRPKPQIVRLSRSDQVYPVSAWVFVERRAYGMFFQRNTPGIEIRELTGLIEN